MSTFPFIFHIIYYCKLFHKILLEPICILLSLLLSMCVLLFHRLYPPFVSKRSFKIKYYVISALFLTQHFLRCKRWSRSKVITVRHSMVQFPYIGWYRWRLYHTLDMHFVMQPICSNNFFFTFKKIHL